MKTVEQLNGVAAPPLLTRGFDSKGALVIDTVHVGIEAELEGVVHVDHVPGWDTIEDGSLRSGTGREYIFRKPRHGASIIKALDRLEQAFNEREPKLTHDASLHVHVDVSRLSVEQVNNLILTSIIFEPLLTKHYCSDRQNNPFCQQVRDTPEILTQWAHYLGSGFRSHITRYTALNLGSLSSFGSLEYRAHPPEWRKEPILEWVNVLLCMYQYALESHVSPTLRLKNMGFEASVYAVFGERVPVLPDDAKLYDIGMSYARRFKSELRGAQGMYSQPSQPAMVGDVVDLGAMTYGTSPRQLPEAVDVFPLSEQPVAPPVPAGRQPGLSDREWGRVREQEQQARQPVSRASEIVNDYNEVMRNVRNRTRGGQ